MERDAPWILEAMRRTHGDVGRLVFAEEQRLAVALHLRSPLHHHPVLGAMMMHLERELLPGVHDEPLHAKARSLVGRLVGPPRSVNHRVRQVLTPSVPAEMLDDLA